MRIDSWTGWPPPASRGGRCCRSARPTATDPRTSQARPSRPGGGCSPIRERPCRPPRSPRSGNATRYWIGDWERFAGRGAVADQVRFDREWGALRAYAAERGVRIFGDIAIYVSPGGCDHRFHPELFQTGLVAGAPPDAYSRDGQLWGNPLYDWPALQRRGYRWWVERVRRTLDLFDLARIDHFRGLVAYWAVPAGARTARGGSWKRGPGIALFRALERELALGSIPAAGAAPGGRGPRRHHRAGGAAAPARGAARDARHPVRHGPRRPAQRPPPGQPHRRPRRLHLDA